MIRRHTVATLIGLVATLVVSGTAVAAKPSSSLSLVVVGSSLTSASTQPSYDGQVTFDVATNQTDRPFVNVRCYQGTAFVYDGWQGFWDGYYTDPVFTLSSGYWTGGAADCSARLVYFDKQGRVRTLASLDFHVAA